MTIIFDINNIYGFGMIFRFGMYSYDKNDFDLNLICHSFKFTWLFIILSSLSPSLHFQLFFAYTKNKALREKKKLGGETGTKAKFCPCWINCHMHTSHSDILMKHIM